MRVWRETCRQWRSSGPEPVAWRGGYKQPKDYGFRTSASSRPTDRWQSGRSGNPTGTAVPTGHCIIDTTGTGSRSGISDARRVSGFSAPHLQIKAYLDSVRRGFLASGEHSSSPTGIVHAERLPGGGWELTTQRGETRRFDSCGSGHTHITGDPRTS